MRRLCFLLLPALLLVLTACAAAERPPITDAADLTGRRIGVNLAWESDYLLSSRKDIELFRYDSTADMLMALNSGKLDAISIDDCTIAVVLGQVGGLEVVEPSPGETGYVLYISPKEPELAADFNAFVADWRASEAYREYLDRQAAFDGLNYVGPELPPDGNGRTIRAAYYMYMFPRSYPDSVTGEGMGYDVEVVRRWAGERGYHLELVASDYNDMVMGTLGGRYDLCFGGVSAFYRADAESMGLLVSDSLTEVPIHLLRKSGDAINMDNYTFE